jgi:hypothetical protein
MSGGLAKNFLTLENTPSSPRSNWSAVRSDLVADALRRSGRLRVRLRVHGEIHGESMLPTLWPGDVVEIESCLLEDIRPGEIVLARRDDRLVLHRLVAPCTANGFLLRGDSVPGPDPLFPPEALLGRLVRGADEGRAASARAAEKVAFRCPAPKGASDFEEVTVSLKRYPDTNRSFSAACTAALRPGFGEKWFGVKWSRALGMLLCHCGMARRLALKLHSRWKASARELRNPEHGAEISSAELGSAERGAL